MKTWKSSKNSSNPRTYVLTIQSPRRYCLDHKDGVSQFCNSKIWCLVGLFFNSRCVRKTILSSLHFFCSCPFFQYSKSMPYSQSSLTAVQYLPFLYPPHQISFEKCKSKLTILLWYFSTYNIPLRRTSSQNVPTFVRIMQ